MKKNFILVSIILYSINSNGQKHVHYPAGFRKAEVPAWVKEKTPLSNVPLRKTILSESNSQLRLTSSVTEETIGNSLYDLQANGAISNRLCVNDDGTISATWTFSPDAIVNTNPPYPQRGTGYNFHDSNGWIYSTGPIAREESSRTGYPNIVVTPTAELIIAHQSVGTTDSTRIIVSRRSGRGSGSWTTSYPWGNSFDAWPKACAAASSGGNENVYVIFHGDPQIIFYPYGPLYFSRSQDGGLSWSPKTIIPLLVVPNNSGFEGDSYSIDARDSIVTIGFGNFKNDLGILKSTDYGVTWTKTIIQQSIYPIPDTTYSNGGDIHVMIDNAGMVHAWFSSLVILYDSIMLPVPIDYSDGLEYWNESMGSNNYIEIIATQDFNGNGIIDFPHDTSAFCSNRLPCGDFGGGLTIHPSTGIDASGVIYLSYSAIDEMTDTTNYPFLRRHVYMMKLVPPYSTSDWTYPEDIIPDFMAGGNGEQQEGVFACTGKRADNNSVYVLYQRDEFAGHSLAASGTCDAYYNHGPYEMILATVDKTTLNVPVLKDDELFLCQNHPNPATALTYFDVGLNRISNISIVLFDAIGKKVYSEERKNIQPGSLTLSIDASKLKAGIYFYCVNANGQKKTRRMIVQ